MKKVAVVLLFICLCAVVEAGKPPPATLPNPVELRWIDLSGYAGQSDFFRGNMQFGDLNNDGSYTDFIRYANSKRMQAFAYTGGTTVNLLWNYTAPVSLPNPPTDYHYKYVIWDIDNDGQTEVIGPFASTSGYIELRILNGATGSVERSITTSMPNPTSDDNILEWRIYITVANFRGLSYPRDIVLLNEYDSYGDIFVYDDALNLLWNTTGDNATKQRIYAHFPYIADIDSDSKDELIGTWVFDHDGTKLWRITPPEWEQYDYFYDHVDRGFIGELDPDRNGQLNGLEIAVSYEYLRAKLYDTSGNIYWQAIGAGTDAKIAALGEITNTIAGQELCIWDNGYSGNTHIFDIDGSDVKTVGRVLDGYQCDYDGNRTLDEVFVPNDKGVICAPWNNEKIYLGPAWRTTPATNQIIFAHALDIVSDYREDLVVADEDEIIILGASGTAPGSYPSPWVDNEYKLMIANKQDDIHPEKMWFNWRKSFGPPDTTPPTPDPMTWATVPYATGSTSIAMVATTASDASGVEYFFDCTTVGGHDSNWQDSTSYTDTGLSPSTTYTYQVQARDKSSNHNTTAFSTTASATTDAGCTASTMHVDSIVCAVVNCGGGKKNGQATVTVKDNCGSPVANATVTGTFTGTYNEQRSGTTNSSGVATITTAACLKSGSFTFCVDNITHASLTYASGDNVETCDSY